MEMPGHSIHWVGVFHSMSGWCSRWNSLQLHREGRAFLTSHNALKTKQKNRARHANDNTNSHSRGARVRVSNTDGLAVDWRVGWRMELGDTRSVWLAWLPCSVVCLVCSLVVLSVSLSVQYCIVRSYVWTLFTIQLSGDRCKPYTTARAITSTIAEGILWLCESILEMWWFSFSAVA